MGWGTEMLLDELIRAASKSLGITPEQLTAIGQRIQKEIPETLEYARVKVSSVDERLESIERFQAGLTQSLSLLTKANLSAINMLQELTRKSGIVALKDERLAVLAGPLDREQVRSVDTERYPGDNAPFVMGRSDGAD